jgi:hypothetical protein
MVPGLDGRSRSGRVTAALARDLLARKPGDRLPTIAEYARRFGAGNGSIDKALRLLHEHRAVHVEARGHLGTFLVARDVGALWTASGGNAIIGAIPRPLSFEIEGLAAGLVTTFARSGIAFTPLSLSGSRQRVAALLNRRVHFIVISADGGERAALEHPVRVVRVLYPTSYYPDDSLVVLTRSDLADPNLARRIAIDLGSYDHDVLTRTQFAGREDVEYVDVPYDLIPDRLADRTVDAAVWHRASRSTVVNAEHWRLHPVVTLETKVLQGAMTQAVILARADDEPICAVLEATIDSEIIAAAQADARAGRFTPNW